jgi:hypothetical protein
MANNLPNTDCGNYKVFVNNFNGVYQLLISGTGTDTKAAHEIATFEMGSDIESITNAFCDKLNYVLSEGYFVSKEMLRHQDVRALYLTFLLEPYSEEFFKDAVRTGLMEEID